MFKAILMTALLSSPVLAVQTTNIKCIENNYGQEYLSIQVSNGVALSVYESLSRSKYSLSSNHYLGNGKYLINYESVGELYRVSFNLKSKSAKVEVANSENTVDYHFTCN